MAISLPVLLSADRAHILRVTATFAGKPVAAWLPAGHPAASGSLPMSWPHVHRLGHNALIEAVAASAPNHCLDGWSYVSRSTSAFLAGDLHASRHLAYYAQLRAVLSILGCLGIGIFNGINFVVDVNGAVARFDGAQGTRGLGTHEAVWGAISRWVTDTSAARQFLDLVRIGGSSLSTCLDAIWPGAAATSVAGTLIEAWGIDLRRGQDDHRSRNMSSYNPQAFEPLPDIASERLDFVEGLWNLFEPVSSASFDLLDRHLLRAMLWQQHELVAPSTPPASGPISRRYLELPNIVRGIASEEFLLGTREPTQPPLLVSARSVASPAMANEMLARAYLLLRAATAFNISNFNDAGVTMGTDSLRAWIDPYAAAKGFWDPVTPLAHPTDLWEDVKLALAELTASMSPAPTSMNEWMKRTPVGLPTVSEAERIGVWSLGS